MAIVSFARKVITFVTCMGRLWKEPSQHRQADPPKSSGVATLAQSGHQQKLDAGSSDDACAAGSEAAAMAIDCLELLGAENPKRLRREDLYARPGLVFGGAWITSDVGNVSGIGESARADEEDVEVAVGSWEEAHDDYLDIDMYGPSDFFHRKPMFDINPATGLLMLDDAIDVAGNPYGFDWH